MVLSVSLPSPFPIPQQRPAGSLLRSHTRSRRRVWEGRKPPYVSLSLPHLSYTPPNNPFSPQKLLEPRQHPVGGRGGWGRRGGAVAGVELLPEGVGADLGLEPVDEARVDAYPLQRLRDLARRGGQGVPREEAFNLGGLLLRGEGAGTIDERVGEGVEGRERR